MKTENIVDTPNTPNTEKIVQLKGRGLNQFVGNLPASRGKTVDEAIEFFGGRRTDDGGVIIKGNVYDYADLIVVDRKISTERIDAIIDETYYYSNANDFACTCGMGLDYLDPDLEQDNNYDSITALIEHLEVLWHVMQDPFAELLEKMGMTNEDCYERFCIPYSYINGWISGRLSPPPYVRVMIAEAVGFLTIRNLT